MANKNNDNRFPVLTLVMQLYKAAALLLGAAIALMTALTFIDGGFIAGIFTAIGGFFFWIVIYASGEAIGVFLSIESSARTLVTIQKHMLQMQQQGGRKKASDDFGA